MDYRFQYAVYTYKANLRIGALNEAYRQKVKSIGIFGYYNDMEHLSQEYCKEQLEFLGVTTMHVLTKGEMGDWLVYLLTKIHKADTFPAGELQGRNIREWIDSLSYDDLHTEWQSYQC